jgi:hypothetical protein
MSQVTGASEVASALLALGRKSFEASQRALNRAVNKVHSTAIRYAPRSPTQAQRRALNKTRRKGKRKADATTRAMPGGLEKSIERRVEGLNGYVYVASNSPGGKYAARIHDGKGKTWKNRGPGTIAKGAKADDKFIERAITDERPNIIKIIEDEHRKVTL